MSSFRLGNIAYVSLLTTDGQRMEIGPLEDGVLTIEEEYASHYSMRNGFQVEDARVLVSRSMVLTMTPTPDSNVQLYNELGSPGDTEPQVAALSELQGEYSTGRIVRFKKK